MKNEYRAWLYFLSGWGRENKKTSSYCLYLRPNRYLHYSHHSLTGWAREIVLASSPQTRNRQQKVKPLKDSSSSPPCWLWVYTEAGEADGFHKKCVEQQHISGITLPQNSKAPQQHLLHRGSSPPGLTGLQARQQWSRRVAACSTQRKQQKKVLQHSKNLYAW